MAGFKNEQQYALVLSTDGQISIDHVTQGKVDSFIHDVVEGYFEAIRIPQCGALGPVFFANDCLMLVNDNKYINNLHFNPIATLIATSSDAESPIIHLFGNAVILRKQGDMLAPFTKDEATDIVLLIQRKLKRGVR